MNPYYEDAWCVIYHGDCREVLPALSADAVLTDPPYAVGMGYASYDDTQENLLALIAEAIPLMRSVAPVGALTPGIANIWRYPPADWVLCLYTPGATSTGSWGFNEWQPLIVYGPDPYLRVGLGRRPDVIKGTSERKIDGHPCPKPLGTWRRAMVRLSPTEGGMFVDPFMGSGTTLKAAKSLGRKAVGIEIEERYCEMAAQRLAQEALDFGGVA